MAGWLSHCFSSEGLMHVHAFHHKLVVTGKRLMTSIAWFLLPVTSSFLYYNPDQTTTQGPSSLPKISNTRSPQIHWKKVSKTEARERHHPNAAREARGNISLLAAEGKARISSCKLKDSQIGWVQGICPGGHLYLKLDIIRVKKNHVIRVVFQNQAMYARTSFRGAKTCKIGKKGMFLVIWQILERTWRTNLRKKRVFRVYFHTWKICV